jgi:hypothetical protein
MTIPSRGNVRVCSTSNIGLHGLQVIDGVMLENGDRVLCNGQTVVSQNGIRVVSAGVWPRARDMATSDDFKGPIVVAVEDGTYRNTFWHMIPAGPVEVGVDAISFAPGFPGPGIEVYRPAAANTGPVAATIWGVTAPVRKRLKTRDAFRSAALGGIYWLGRAGDLTGITAGKEGLFHVLFDPTGGDATNMTFLVNGTARFQIYKGTDNRIRIRGHNAAGTKILDMRTDTAFTAADGPVVLTGSWNLSTRAARLYANGVADMAVGPTLIDDVIDYPASQWDVGGFSGTQLLHANLAVLMFHDVYVDLSNPRELRRFQTADGRCARMAAGRVFDSYDTRPLLFIAGGGINIAHNHGSAGNDVPFLKPAGTPPTAAGSFGGSIYKDLAIGDLQAGSPVLLTWDSVEGVWVAPIALNRTVFLKDYGATGTTETFIIPLETAEIEMDAAGPGGSGGGGSAAFPAGAGGSGVRTALGFKWHPMLGGVPITVTLRSPIPPGAGSTSGNGADGATGGHTIINLPVTLGGLEIQAGAGMAGEGGKMDRPGRAGRGSTTAQTGLYPNSVTPTQFNYASAHGEHGFHWTGAASQGGHEGDIGGGGPGGAAGGHDGQEGQGSYLRIKVTVEE